MTTNGTPLQRMRDRGRRIVPAEKVRYLQERGLEIAVEDAREIAEAAVIDAGEAQATADTAVEKADEAQADADTAQLTINETLSGDRSFTGLQVDGLRVEDFLGHTDGEAIADPAAVPASVIETQVRASVSGSGPVSYSAGSGVFGWTGGKSDVGLGNVDNTSDMAKPVSTAQQTALDLKAPLASPALTGLPTAPTASASDDSTKLATTAFVQAVIANLIAMAPGTLDTLDELAAALGDDPNFAATVTTALATKLVKANNLSDLTNVATARANLGLAIGTDVQAYSATLALLAALSTTTYGRSVLVQSDAGAHRTALSLGNVENKSSATIRGELTSGNVTGALGYTPPNPSAEAYTPTWNGGSVTVNYATAVKIGPLVFASIDLSVGSSASTDVSSFTLPYSMADTYGAGSVNFSDYGAALHPHLEAGGIQLRPALNAGSLTCAQIAGKRVILSTTYRAA